MYLLTAKIYENIPVFLCFITDLFGPNLLKMIVLADINYT